ncbi:MAG: 5-bromo-4-chloroindolyl phosphate hydrolysis family protein [Desulfovibrio sp.]|jgi:hypothetical protein|nr:5-bromo-4-chloroindolyl phosphate hydrolysis family protein [Desulfovibrio sp.]
MTIDDTLGKIGALADRSIAFFTGAALRLLVHFSSLAAAGVACAALPDVLPWTNSAFMVIAVYTGCICLFPRGTGKHAAWIIPTVTGAFQCLIWVFWGVPWPLTILWGGFQTWVIRLLARKGNMGWEWASLPWMIFALYGFFTHLAPSLSAPLPLWTFPLLSLSGWGILCLYTRLKEKLRKAATQKRPKNNGLASRIDAWHGAAMALREKKCVLPPDMQTHISNMVEATENILDYLRASPHDAVATGAFLSRYLTVAQTMLDDYARVSGQECEDDTMSRNAIRSNELLKRLEKAFADERERLLRKDVADFTVNINVLDKLLKMDGK